MNGALPACSLAVISKLLSFLLTNTSDRYVDHKTRQVCDIPPRYCKQDPIKIRWSMQYFPVFPPFPSLPLLFSMFLLFCPNQSICPIFVPYLFDIFPILTPCWCGINARGAGRCDSLSQLSFIDFPYLLSTLVGEENRAGVGGRREVGGERDWLGPGLALPTTTTRDHWSESPQEKRVELGTKLWSFWGERKIVLRYVYSSCCCMQQQQYVWNWGFGIDVKEKQLIRSLPDL